MASQLTNLVKNLTGGIHKIKCRYGQDDKKCETCRIKYKGCGCCLEYIKIKDYLYSVCAMVRIIKKSLIRT